MRTEPSERGVSLRDRLTDLVRPVLLHGSGRGAAYPSFLDRATVAGPTIDDRVPRGEIEKVAAAR